MWIERLIGSSVTHGLELATRFAESRHEVIAENVANIHTPDYHARRLDPAHFETALAEAFERADKAGVDRLELRGARQVATDASGALRTRPTTEPARNILFHDGSNTQLEHLMSDLQQNALRYTLTAQLLQGRWDGMMSAIRGRVT